jgi:hypothetical protein
MCGKKESMSKGSKRKGWRAVERDFAYVFGKPNKPARAAKATAKTYRRVAAEQTAETNWAQVALDEKLADYRQCKHSLYEAVIGSKRWDDLLYAMEMIYHDLDVAYHGDYRGEYPFSLDRTVALMNYT